MPREKLSQVVEVAGAEKVRNQPRPRNYVFAIGHFGNFELLAHINDLLPGYTFATTYRALRQAGLNELLVELREGSGCEVFERRTEAPALRARMNQGGMALGLLSDQNGGRGGVQQPFMGIEASTSTAPAVLALRYDADLYTAFVYRTGRARWRVEVGDRIRTVIDGKPREVEDLIREMNTAFEAAVRRDPANWFWVHDRWRLARQLRKQNLPVVNS
jgi:KDO2-lipid IV(A) lauroyltransferase